MTNVIIVAGTDAKVANFHRRVLEGYWARRT